MEDNLQHCNIPGKVFWPSGPSLDGISFIGIVDVAAVVVGVGGRDSWYSTLDGFGCLSSQCH